jgi:vanillate/3-O-methylgallate O-demethylase
MQFRSLQEKLDHFGSAIDMMRNSQVGPYVHPIPAELSNWRDEQLAWREGVALMDQSYHMTDLYVKGPDVRRLVADLGVNSFASFGRNKAKQLITCNHDGFLIGDMILFGLEEDEVDIVGRPTVANWVQFNAETGGYDVTVHRDERSVSNPMPRKTFRFELQGPNAWKLLEKLNGGPVEDIRFFNMGEVKVAGRRLRALRHGMGGAPGLEFWGPVELGPEVKAAILTAGEEFGLRQVGGRAYSSAAVDSGWIPCPVPGIYAGEAMRPYRQWLKADSFDAIASLGGSFCSDRIEDYYFSPWDLDYGRLVKFDHDFVGRAALEKKVKEPHRKKVSLVWNPDDVAAIHRSLGEEKNGKYMELPTAHYSSYPYDSVLRNGRTIGVSTYLSYLFADRAWVSLAVVDEAEAEIDRELTVVWGEENGGSNRPLVERHVQMEVRATVAAWPFSKLARQGYRKGNR